MALRMLKASFNADTDGLAGLQQFAGDATLMYYTTDEAKEGRDAFKEKRKPDFKQFPKFPWWVWKDRLGGPFFVYNREE